MRRFARPLLYVGVVGVVLGMSKVHAAYVADPPYDYTGSFRFGWSLAYMALLAGAAYGVGLPDVPRTTRDGLAPSVLAAVVAAGAMSLLQLVVGDALLPRFVVFGSAVLVVPWYVVCVALASGGRARAEAAERVVVVATPAEVAAARAELDHAPEKPASIVVGLSAADATGSGEHHPLAEAVVGAAATVVVLGRAAQGDERIVAQAAELHGRGVRLRTLSLFYEEWLGKLPLSELERTSLMFDIGELHRARYGRLKRLLDVSIALCGLVVLVLLVPVVLVGDLVANRGSLFFGQPRVGKQGREFRMLKFRTMRPSAAADGEWTGEDDPRVTAFGGLLRRTHVDELPQVVNILRGDLSVVGPRPEQPHYVEQLRVKLPFYDVRHLVRPGLTGWAQVKYRYGADETDALEKLQYEFYYLRHQGLGLDMRIIGRTIRSVVGRGGR